MTFNWDAALPFVLVTISIPLLSVVQKAIFGRIVAHLSSRLDDYRGILERAVANGKLTEGDVASPGGHVHDALADDPAEIEAMIISDADRMAVITAIATSVPAFILIVRESSVVVVAVAVGFLAFATLLFGLLPNEAITKPAVVVTLLHKHNLPSITRLGITGFAIMVVVTIGAGLLTPVSSVGDLIAPRPLPGPIVSR